jgi:hypothetical protein
MMPGNLFHLELASALGDRRRLMLRIVISFLLVLPFLFVEMPPRARAAGLTMVILFTSFFGAAVHHARLRADGRLARLHLLPVGRGVLWLDLALASMLARLGPALVVLGCFVLVNSRRPVVGDLIDLAGLLCGALLLLTLLGMVVGRLAQNNGEVHLFGALVAALLALVSGLAPLPDRLTWLAALAPWNPISHLLAALTALAADRPDVSGARLVVALVILAAISAAAVQRWVSGRGPGLVVRDPRLVTGDP